MLEALKNCPADIANSSSDLTAGELLGHYLCISVTLLGCYWVVSAGVSFLTHTLQLTAGTAALTVAAGVVLITLVLYVYFVYVVSMGGGEEDKRTAAPVPMPSPSRDKKTGQEERQKISHQSIHPHTHPPIQPVIMRMITITIC